MSIQHRLISGFAVAALVFTVHAAAPQDPKSQQALESQLARGRYLAQIAGCNDCHTAGYAQTGGQVPEKDWLMGDTLGWHGPWGTTYAINLRLYMQDLTEDEWIKMARKLKTRPPMPWFALNQMTDEDLRALYQFIKYLGPAGKPVPAYVPPDQEPKPPYVSFPGP